MSYAFARRPACPVCASQERSTLLCRPFTHPSLRGFLESYYAGRVRPEDLADGSYEIARCRRCGLLWQVDVLGEEGMAALYGRWISRRESLAKKSEAGAELFLTYAREAAAACSLLERSPHRIRALDFGMGWGHWCRMARAFGVDAWGFEVDPERVAYARGLGVEAFGTWEDLPARGFDFINCEQVFEHLPEPRATLLRLCDLLRRRGVLRIAVPNARGAAAGLRSPGWQAAKDALHPLEHVNAFTNRTLRRFAASAGLELSPRQPWTLPLAEPRQWAKRLLGPLFTRHLSTSLYFVRREGG